MANILTRIRRGLDAGLYAFRSAPDMKAAAVQLDKMVASHQLDDPEEKQLDKSKSRLDIRNWQANLAYANAYDFMSRWIRLQKERIPDYGDPARDFYLSRLWMEEPIMAGAVYSMSAKMTALKWSVTGRRLAAKNAALLIASAAHMDGWDWGGFISSVAGNFYTTNRGVFIETPRNGDPLIGPLAGIGHIDALNCVLTGNKDTPMIYASDTTGQIVYFKPGEYIHFTSQPSPREIDLGMGFCAVDRAFRAINLLIGLHDYDDEKLSNLPPEGVAAVTGLTMSEFQDALTLWKVKREQDKSLTFPQVLWLIGSQPQVKVEVDFKGFSSIPESFDRQSVVTHYVSTLALCFGVDPREFWPISSGALGTASESEIQHLKAKGKGPGEFISTFERHMNGELPEDVQFAFDTQDIEEDSNAAMVAKAWIDAYYPLYTGTPAGKSKASPGGKPNTEMVPNAQEIPKTGAANVAMGQTGPLGQPGGVEQIITKDELRRLLADKGVLPEWMMNDERYMITDTQVHIRKDDEGDDNEIARYEYSMGILKEVRPGPIVLQSQPVESDVPYAETESIAKSTNGHKSIEEALLWLQAKEDEVMELHRNIHGNPIPDKEVTRGARVTAATVKAELERWRNHPILSKYADFTEAELEKLYETVS